MTPEDKIAAELWACPTLTLAPYDRDSLILELAKVVGAAIKDEREACAKVVEGIGELYFGITLERGAIDAIVDAIRSRGDLG